MNYKQIEEMLTEVGLFGLCGKVDMRDIHEASSHDAKAKLAQEIFCYRLTKYIGAYIAAMNGVNAIVLHGGIRRERFLDTRGSDEESQLLRSKDKQKRKQREQAKDIRSAFHSMGVRDTYERRADDGKRSEKGTLQQIDFLSFTSHIETIFKRAFGQK